jgi:hypothetical protein
MTISDSFNHLGEFNVAVSKNVDHSPAAALKFSRRVICRSFIIDLLLEITADSTLYTLPPDFPGAPRT